MRTLIRFFVALLRCRLRRAGLPSRRARRRVYREAPACRLN